MVDTAGYGVRDGGVRRWSFMRRGGTIDRTIVWNYMIFWVNKKTRVMQYVSCPTLS